MTATSLTYYQDQLGKVIPRVSYFNFNITGAKASTPIVPNTSILTSYDAISAQSTIDNFLGTSSEFNVLAFDATSMGTDAWAAIVNLGGQARTLVAVKVRTLTGTAGGTAAFNALQATAAGLTNTSLTAQCALGSSGNVAVRSIVTGMDGFTTGMIELEVMWIAK